jgi:hypothetical protein
MEKPQTPTADTDNFLAMVRESNEKRASAKEEPENNNGDENAEEDKESKESKEDSKEGQEGGLLDSSSGTEEQTTVTVDPLQSRTTKPQKKTKEDNIVGMRKALTAEREKIASLEQQVKERDDKLASSGDVVELKGQLEEATKKISELSKYESLLGLKQSKEYKAKYIDGVDNLLKQLGAIAKDYGVGNDVLKKAIATGNRKDLNQLLAREFDSVAVNDVRPIVLEIQNLLIEKKRAEVEPDKVEAELIKQTEAKEKAEQFAAKTRMEKAVQEGWGEMVALYSSKDSGVDVLKEVPGNEDHNAQRLAILKTGAKEYGDVMGIFARNGLRNIPEDIAKALSARFQLSEVATYLISKNHEQNEELTKLRSENKRLRGYQRPLANGNSPKTGNAQPPQKMDTRQIAEHVFQVAADKLSNR